VERGVSIGGYGEALVQDFADEREDGTASGKIAQADFLRVLGYTFSDTLLFNSKIEFEHGSTGTLCSAARPFRLTDATGSPPCGPASP
jgi:hypothetical protein